MSNGFESDSRNSRALAKPAACNVTARQWLSHSLKLKVSESAAVTLLLFRHWHWHVLVVHEKHQGIEG
jgi:hypothetical protein